MSKHVKGLIEKDLVRRFEGVGEFVVVSVRGIAGTENNEMRGELKKKDIHLTVVKNSLAGRAFANLGMGPISEVFSGPSAVVFGGDSIVDLAKEMVDWNKKLDQLEIKGAVLEGKVLDAAGAKALSKMPNRAELQGTIVMIAKAPGSRIAGAATGPGGRIAGCIKALVEKKEETGG